jgi:hypothetical protein
MKIIQIAATEFSGEDGASGTLYALADDGSVWMMVDPWRKTNLCEWKKLPQLEGDED